MRPGSRFRGQSGLSLLELMFAITILAIGMAAGMILITGAIASNNRNKLDTTATMLSQGLLEQIIAFGPDPAGTFNVTDCLGNITAVDPRVQAGQPSSGATVVNGQISFAGTAPPGYGMQYTECRANGQTATYDVRWYVQTLNASPGPPRKIYTKLVIVSARQTGTNNGGPSALLLFSPPITLRAIAASQTN